MAINSYRHRQKVAKHRAIISSSTLTLIPVFSSDVCTRSNSDTRQTMKPTSSRRAASVKRLASELVSLLMLSHWTVAYHRQTVANFIHK